MRPAVGVLLFVFLNFLVNGQPSVVEPGSKGVSLLAICTGKFIWESNNTVQNAVSVERSGQRITIVTHITKNGDEVSRQTIKLDALTLEPLSEDYSDEEGSYSLQYGATVSGKRTISETGNTVSIHENVAGKHFSAGTIPFVVTALPISLDYRATIPVIRFDNNWKPAYLKYRITEVSEDKSFSCLSGVHQIWKVTVKEKTSNHLMIVFLDKATRRILRTEQSFDGMHLSQNTFILADSEKDINPIKASFNFSETMAMLSGGTSTIEGSASTRIAEKRMEGNKVQYAPKGSVVTLMPNTPYFKEWVNYNFTIGNISRPVYYDGKLVSGCAYPLPDEVKKAMVYAEVEDNKGNFRFKNLKPGEYLIFVGFVANKYTHTTRTPTGNYNITISSDGYGSATQTVDVRNWMSPRDILNHQFVKVEKDGETVKVKLK